MTILTILGARENPAFLLSFARRHLAQVLRST